MTSVAIVGSGVAGLTAAYIASKRAQVILFEADDRLGGHADTQTVSHAGRELHIDTGFIVHNRRTYPTLLRIFAELDVPTQESEMSMSMRSDADRLEWAGALGPAGIFPTWRNATRPAYLRMLTEIPRFHRQARRLLDTDDDRTLGEFLRDGGFSPFFRRHFMTPLVAAVWSCDPEVSMDYPAAYLFAFLSHHGMLQIFGSPPWRTVTGGSQQYVARIADVVTTRGGQILSGTPVTSVRETQSGVEIIDAHGVVRSFDAVVLAAHPQQTLAMLAEPTPVQRELLSAMPYSRNQAQLHTDVSVMPRQRRAWASWNHLERPGTGAVTVTYDLTRLMRLETDTHFLVSLGAADLVDPAQVVKTLDYEHPIYSPSSVAAQRRMGEAETSRISLAGAWRGWGFHEDGARSGAEAVERLGLGWGSSGAAPPVTSPRRYATTISHTRRTPMTRRFEHHSTFWVVDLDHLPDHGVLARFEARDHLGDPAGTLRGNVEAFLARHDLRADGQILMAAHARAFGHCFNPISVFWCHDRSGRQVATIVEVHNTYGDRHAYLVHPDEEGRARTAKKMYVSPFHGVDGIYDVVVPEPDDTLHIAVRLTSTDGVFDASLRGAQVAVPLWRMAPAALLGSLLIRLHGVTLWARRLSLRPRPVHAQEGVQP